MDSKIKKYLLFLLSSLLFLLLTTTSSYSKEYVSCSEENWQEIIDGMFSSFALPLEKITEKKSDNIWDEVFSNFGGGFGFGYPLKESEPQADEGLKTQGRRANNLTLSASLRYSPLPNWFFSTTFYKYLNPHLIAPWSPDFSYTFGYDDWHPYTFALTYSNYGGNRIFPDAGKGEVFTDFLGGGFSLSWKYKVPECIQQFLKVHKTSSFGGSLSLVVVPNYFDLESLETKNWKRSIRINMKYTIYEWFYVNATVFYYPVPEQQQPWDPDFTYGFGFFDWHPGTISIQYNNYSGNRYPWNILPGSGGFLNGGLSLSWGWKY